MSPKILSAIVSAILMFMLLLFWLFDDEPVPTTPPPQAQTEDVSGQAVPNISNEQEFGQIKTRYLKLKKRLDELQGEQRAIAADMDRLYSALQTYTRKTLDLEPAVSVDTPAHEEMAQTKADSGQQGGAKETLEQAELKTFEDLDKYLAKQPVDKVWSDKGETAILEVIDKHDPQGKILSRVNCRTNYCRVESFHASNTQANRFVGLFPTWLAWRTDHKIKVYSEGDRVRAVLLISRKGHELPPLKKGK